MRRPLLCALLVRHASQLRAQGQGAHRTMSERSGARSGRVQPRPALLLRSRHLLSSVGTKVAFRECARRVVHLCMGVYRLALSQTTSCVVYSWEGRHQTCLQGAPAIDTCFSAAGSVTYWYSAQAVTGVNNIRNRAEYPVYQGRGEQEWILQDFLNTQTTCLARHALHTCHAHLNNLKPRETHPQIPTRKYPSANYPLSPQGRKLTCFHPVCTQ